MAGVGRDTWSTLTLGTEGGSQKTRFAGEAQKVYVVPWCQLFPGGHETALSILCFPWPFHLPGALCRSCRGALEGSVSLNPP